MQQEAKNTQHDSPAVAEVATSMVRQTWQDQAITLASAYGSKVCPIRLSVFWTAIWPGVGGAAPLQPLFRSFDSEDWKSFVSVAQTEQLSAWLSYRLSINDLGCPSESLQVLDAAGSLRRSWTRLLAMGTIDVVNKLDHAGIVAVPLKGALLAQQLYGDATLRDTRDIDIQVTAEKAHAAALAIVGMGYRCDVDTGWLCEKRFIRTIREVSFRKLGGAFEIDLHWRLNVPWLAPSTRVTPSFDSQQLGKSALLNCELNWWSLNQLDAALVANIRANSQIETKLAVDLLRLRQTLGTTDTPLKQTSEIEIASYIGLTTPKLVANLAPAASLTESQVMTDLFRSHCGATGHAARWSSWRRHYQRAATSKKRLKLLEFALAPTITDYGDHTPAAATTMWRLSTMLRKLRRD